MFKITKVKIVVISVLFVLLKLTWPVYEAFAHKGKVAFLPFYQFTKIPEGSPTQQIVHNSTYQKAADQTLNLLTAHRVNINAPAISAAVAIDGELVWAGAAGWADIATQTPANTKTQFRIGSTSKALTATALATMVDKNEINIDKPISDYLVNIPPRWHNMTARQLISHTAGLPHYKHNTDYFGLYKTLSLSTRYENVTDALAVFDDSDLLFKPGAQFSYSSFGIVLLSAVMEHAVQTPYLDIMQKRIFTPLNMSSTAAEFNIEDSENLARFYWNNEGESDQVRQWRTVDLSHRLAGGGFVSTSSDLVKMGIATLDSGFISAKTRNAFWTPQTLPDGSETPNGYSLGWRYLTIKVDDEFGTLTVANHGGVSRGAQSWLMVIPQYNLSVAVNINSNTDVFWGFANISMQIAKQFILAKKASLKSEPVKLASKSDSY
jgi:serine beta-lactamase-like protein LACTB